MIYERFIALIYKCKNACQVLTPRRLSVTFSLNPSATC